MKFVSNIPERADAYFKSLDKQIVAAAVRAAHKTGISGEAKAKAIIAKEAHDTGEGLRSVTHNVDVTPNEVRLSIFAAAAHMIFQELGRKPGSWPNLNALTKWVGRKLREKGVNTKVNLTFDQLKALAKSSTGAQKDAYRQHLSMLYLVGRKIATKGTREKLIFKRIQAALLKEFRATLLIEFQSIS